MDGMHFNVLIRSFTRSRRSVLTGAACASALVAPAVAGAGKAGKVARKRCKKQQGDCEAVARAHCEGDICLNALLPCCALLATCNAGEATRCFLAG